MLAIGDHQDLFGGHLLLGQQPTREHEGVLHIGAEHPGASVAAADGGTPGGRAGLQYANPGRHASRAGTGSKDTISVAMVRDTVRQGVHDAIPIWTEYLLATVPARVPVDSHLDLFGSGGRG